jgi:multidrug efflux pump subunit AcrB
MKIGVERIMATVISWLIALTLCAALCLALYPALLAIAFIAENLNAFF